MLSEFKNASRAPLPCPNRQISFSSHIPYPNLRPTAVTLYNLTLNIRINQPIYISTGERPFVDILQDRRFWIIHLITIPSPFLSRYVFVLSGLVSRIFSGGSLNEYFFADSDQLAIINDRFSVLSEIEDV